MASPAVLQIARLESRDLEVIRPWFRTADFWYLTTRPHLLDSGAIRRLLAQPDRHFYLVAEDSRPVALGHWEGDPDNPRIGTAGFRLAPGESESLGQPGLRLFLDTLLALHHPAILVHQSYAFDHDQQRRLWEGAGFVRRGLLRRAVYRSGRRWDVYVYQYRGGTGHA